MSDRPLRRARRAHIQMLPQELEDYKRRCLGALGWVSKTDEHAALKAGIGNTIQAVADATLRPDPQAAAAMQAMAKGAGSTFTTYQKLLTAFERKDNRSPEDEAKLRQAAQAYLDHAKGYKEKERDLPNNVAKVESCTKTLADLAKLDRLRGVEEDLGSPPWDSKTAMQAASLRAELDFETLPTDKKIAPRLEGGGKNQAFWINKQAAGGVAKTFIFKPANPMDAPGFPNGGEPAREAMAGRVADMLNDALKLDIPMPETHVVSLPTSSFDDAELDNLQRRSPTISGSLQTFAATGGEMRDRSRADLARVPAEDCQAAAVLDMITLNTDRHAGNFLVRDKSDGSPELVPIDHGMTFPTRDSADHIVQHMGSPHNALLSLPGSHQPFSDEMKAKLAALNPTDMEIALKRERDVLADAQPGTAGTLTDESIMMAKRSAMFLRRAADTLTPAAAQVSLSRFNRQLFDPALPEGNAFNAVADQIIQDAANEQADIAEYFLMSEQQQNRLKQKLLAAGWNVGQADLVEDSILLNPALAMKLYKSGAVLPPAQPNGNARPADLGDPGVAGEIAAAQAAFPTFNLGGSNAEQTTKQRDLLELWREYNALNGSPQAVELAATKIGMRKGLTTLATDLRKSVEVLKDAQRVDAAVAQAPAVADPAKRSLERKLDFIGELAANLAGSQGAAMRQALIVRRTNLQGIDSSTQAGKLALGTEDAELEGLIDRMTTAVQTRLRLKVNLLRSTPLVAPEVEAVRQGNLQTLSNAVEAGAFETFYQVLGRINDANWTAAVNAP